MADSLAALPLGLARALFDTGAAGKLAAAQLYALSATPQEFNETLAAGSVRHAVWKRVVAGLARLDAHDPETATATASVVTEFLAGFARAS